MECYVAFKSIRLIYMTQVERYQTLYVHYLVQKTLDAPSHFYSQSCKRPQGVAKAGTLKPSGWRKNSRALTTESRWPKSQGKTDRLYAQVNWGRQQMQMAPGYCDPLQAKSQLNGACHTPEWPSAPLFLIAGWWLSVAQAGRHCSLTKYITPMRLWNTGQCLLTSILVATCVSRVFMRLCLWVLWMFVAFALTGCDGVKDVCGTHQNQVWIQPMWWTATGQGCPEGGSGTDRCFWLQTPVSGHPHFTSGSHSWKYQEGPVLTPAHPPKNWEMLLKPVLAASLGLVTQHKPRPWALCVLGERNQRWGTMGRGPSIEPPWNSPELRQSLLMCGERAKNAPTIDWVQDSSSSRSSTCFPSLE